MQTNRRGMRLRFLMWWERCVPEPTAVGWKYKLPSPSRETLGFSTTLTTVSS